MKQFQIEEICKGAGSIAVSGHVRPDGDCVGSVMAMYLYLQKTLPQAEVHAYLEEPAAVFSCIKGIGSLEDATGEDRSFDVFIALDCAKDRLGAAEGLFDRAGMRINIDHHISNAQGCGDINYVVPSASSTCELVFDVCAEEKLDEEIAKALYIGMIHDTGVFQYSNTSPKTLQIAAQLISFGFDFPRLIDETFYEKTYAQNQILGRALLESFLFMDGLCVVSSVSRKTMDFFGVGPKDLDGIVSQLRNIKGVECAIFLYQTGVQEYKASLRSNGKVDVAQVAQYFGGGGHVRAAGCTMSGTVYDVINNLSGRIEAQLKEEMA